MEKNTSEKNTSEKNTSEKKISEKRQFLQLIRRWYLIREESLYRCYALHF